MFLECFWYVLIILWKKKLFKIGERYIIVMVDDFE